MASGAITIATARAPERTRLAGALSALTLAAVSLVGVAAFL